uniref:Uncharacterized protein n=1 Tax=uncultured marine virus TaxID=186617 RepID=A0A0F7L9U3_9VIRU|nr:hypothetical protein [uncultured marine virus]
MRHPAPSEAPAQVRRFLAGWLVLFFGRVLRSISAQGPLVAPETLPPCAAEHERGSQWLSPQSARPYKTPRSSSRLSVAARTTPRPALSSARPRPTRSPLSPVMCPSPTRPERSTTSRTATASHPRRRSAMAQTPRAASRSPAIFVMRLIRQWRP